MMIIMAYVKDNIPTPNVSKADRNCMFKSELDLIKANQETDFIIFLPVNH